MRNCYQNLIRKVIELKSRRTDITSVGNWHRLFPLILEQPVYILYLSRSHEEKDERTVKSTFFRWLFSFSLFFIHNSSFFLFWSILHRNYPVCIICSSSLSLTQPFYPPFCIRFTHFCFIFIP